MLVSRGERLGNRQQVGGTCQAKAAARPGRAQRAAAHPFEDEKRQSVGLADIVDRQNVGVVQGGERSRLTTKPVGVLGADARGLHHELQRDIAIQLSVASSVHAPLAAFAETSRLRGACQERDHRRSAPRHDAELRTASYLPCSCVSNTIINFVVPSRRSLRLREIGHAPCRRLLRTCWDFRVHHSRAGAVDVVTPPGGDDADGARDRSDQMMHPPKARSPSSSSIYKVKVRTTTSPSWGRLNDFCQFQLHFASSLPCSNSDTLLHFQKNIVATPPSESNETGGGPKGATVRPTTPTNTRPLKSAYSAANNFAAPGVSIRSTGPMPLRIIEALRNASSQLSPPAVW